MNSRSVFPLRGPIALVALILLLTSSESYAAPAPRQEVNRAITALFEARAYAAAGQFQQAEAALAATLAPGANAAERQFQISVRLADIAAELGRSGQIEPARATAAHALARVDASLQGSAGSSQRAARLQFLKGRLQELSGAGRKAALEAYQKAAVLDPEFRDSAQAVRRLTSAGAAAKGGKQ